MHSLSCTELAQVGKPSVVMSLCLLSDPVIFGQHNFQGLNPKNLLAIKSESVH